MKIALIAPLDMLDLVEEYNTEYHLILPHLAISYPNYNNFYADIKGYKILDNGAAEDELVDHDDLHLVAWQTKADEIVVPDVMGNCQATIEKVWAFEKWAQPHNFKYAGVVQGQTMAEVVKCLNFYDHCGWISTVHIPRILNRLIHRTFRYTLLDALTSNIGSHFSYRFDQIHCLGASEWLTEVAALNSVPIIRGMDTSLPFVMGLAGRFLTGGQYLSRQSDYFNLKCSRQSTNWKVVKKNVELYLSWGGHFGDSETSGSEV